MLVIQGVFVMLVINDIEKLSTVFSNPIFYLPNVS